MNERIGIPRRGLIIGAMFVTMMFLFSATPVAKPAAAYSVTKTIYVKIEACHQLDPMDVGSDADFYGKVIFGISSKTSGVWDDNARDVYPNWIASFATTYDTTSPSKSLMIELWDDDVFSDNRADISWQGGTNSLALTVNMNTGVWTGDDGYYGDTIVGYSNGEADGQAGDYDDCSIYFDIWLSSYN